MSFLYERILLILPTANIGVMLESGAWGEITRLHGCQTASSQSRL